jgi:hypothetical protein
VNEKLDALLKSLEQRLRNFKVVVWEELVGAERTGITLIADYKSAVRTMESDKADVEEVAFITKRIQDVMDESDNIELKGRWRVAVMLFEARLRDMHNEKQEQEEESKQSERRLEQEFKEHKKERRKESKVFTKKTEKAKQDLPTRPYPELTLEQTLQGMQTSALAIKEEDVCVLAECALSIGKVPLACKLLEFVGDSTKGDSIIENYASKIKIQWLIIKLCLNQYSSSSSKKGDIRDILLT